MKQKKSFQMNIWGCKWRWDEWNKQLIQENKQNWWRKNDTIKFLIIFSRHSLNHHVRYQLKVFIQKELLIVFCFVALQTKFNVPKQVDYVVVVVCSPISSCFVNSFLRKQCTCHLIVSNDFKTLGWIDHSFFIIWIVLFLKMIFFSRSTENKWFLKWKP